MFDTPTHYEVFFIGGQTGWCYGPYDAEGNIVGNCQYEWRKSDAICAAKRHDLPVKVYGRNGDYQRTV